MGSVKKRIEPGWKKAKSKEHRSEKQYQAYMAQEEAKEMSRRQAVRSRSIYGYGGRFGVSENFEDEALVRTRRLLA